ncbi:MAG: chromosome segregation protein SMC [Bacillota bacterium]
MKLTKIEIYGFKSFYNKTVITPGEKITAIVGPNGCGKSNVADAIRWVMGEQSSKILRGSSMSDVIFNGTAQRKSLSYAEVSLVFDNADGAMPLEYAEVTIARKLYRSGESEYLINGKNVRLKDITNLIRSSKMGREGYSIIGQGKVEEFINAKPEERRTLFDEATGIAGSKQKRSEAERKLSRSDDNLVRYKDILQEIDRTLEPLEGQAEDAKKYFSLKESLKYNEVNYYIHKKDSRDKELESVYKKIQALAEELAVKEDSLEKANAEYITVLENMDGADDKIKELREKQLDFSLLKEKEDGKRKLHAQKIDFLYSQIESVEDQTARLEKSIEADGDKQLEIAKEIQNLLGAKEETEKVGGETVLLFEETKNSRDSLARKIEEFERREKENIYSASDVTSELAKLDFEMQSVESQASELSERKAQLDIETAKKTAEKEACNARGREVLSSLENLQKSRFDLEASVQESSLKLDKIKENIAICDKFTAESSAREKMVQELQNSYEGYSSAVKRLFKDAGSDNFLSSKINGTVANLVKVPKGLEMAIEAALQNAFQNVVVPAVQDAKTLISYLRNKNYGQVTFLPLDTVKPRSLRGDQMSVLKENGVLGIACDLVSFDKKYQTAFESLLGAVVVCEDIDSGIAVQKKYHSGFKIVTKLGEIFATSGSVTGGSAKQGVGNVLSYQNKLDEIKIEREKAAAKRADLEILEKQMAEKIEKQKAETAKVTAGMQKLEVEKAQSIETLKSVAIAEQRDIFELRSVNQKLEMASVRLLEIQNETARLSGISESMAKDGEKASDEVSELKTNLQNANLKLEEISALLATKNLEVTKIDGEIQNAKQRENAIKENISSSEFLLASCDESHEKIKGEIKDLQAEVFEEIDETYINNLKDDISRFESWKKDLSENLQKIDVRKGYATIEVQKLTAKKQNLEASADDDSELFMLAESLSDEYGEIDFEKEKDENFNPSGSKSTIKKIKGEIFALGNINTQAIEEYAKLSARHDEMTSHKEDMEKASDDLRKVIDSLNLEMNSTFFDEFEKIGENFNSIFTELFGGGNAKLKLIENESGDSLTYGIDIEAKPPGKTLQSMTLLSGGEKALTAIAIIIAIMRARPMPFCVFDEIEAALDDVNCKRFASYINNFADPTQFIIITHKKSTMEVANNLFGVTMEEKGLSKLVSVSISDVS